MLAQPAETAHDRAVRWRQLVELAARAPSDGDLALLADAIAHVRDEAPGVDERVRSASALAIASLPLPADLVAAFAADRLHVAAPVLASARLTPSEWKLVAAAASEDCRGFLASMRSEQQEPPVARPAPRELAEGHAIPSISDVVARIERLRESREPGFAAPAAEPAPAEQPGLFRWECGESGEIDWVEGVPRGALVGQSIAQRGSGTGVDRTVERAFASRAPFHDGVLELPLELASGGRWKLSGIPAFERTTGRFAGYRGIAERADAIAAGAGGVLGSDPNALRELVHEIKTPLNAIIGFAEIITGEYLGPADSRYRERASEIVTQARLLLSAIEDLDFAARIHSANGAASARCDLGELVERVVSEIRDAAASSGVEIETGRSSQVIAAVQPELAERLILRMCSALVARAGRDEILRLTAACEGKTCVVSMSRPQALQGLPEEVMFGRPDDALSAAFPLRLARGLAQAAGASLTASDRAISLSFASA